MCESQIWTWAQRCRGIIFFIIAGLWYTKEGKPRNHNPNLSTVITRIFPSSVFPSSFGNILNQQLIGRPHVYFVGDTLFIMLGRASLRNCMRWMAWNCLLHAQRCVRSFGSISYALKTVRYWRYCVIPHVFVERLPTDVWWTVCKSLPPFPWDISLLV